jgi:hypothetical protein
MWACLSSREIISSIGFGAEFDERFFGVGIGIALAFRDRSGWLAI